MAEMTIKNIEVTKIYPHPDNPRKDLRNLEETVESIKQKGILQNLTVVPGHFEGGKKSLDGYTVIIGHRRLEAAKQAGLHEVPCRIVDMDEKEQFRTMMIENMQRDNLTIREQAEGFQHMLDFGDTRQDIAEKTGFSTRTIDHRLEIAKLDQDILQEKEADGSFQMTLTGLAELEKIKDIDKRNEVLKKASSSNDLAYKAEQASTEEKCRAAEKKITAQLESIGMEKGPEGIMNEYYSGKWKVVVRISLENDAEKEIDLGGEAPSELKYYRSYREILILKKAMKKKKVLSEYEKKEKEKKQRKKKIKAVCKEMENDRRDYVRLILAGKISIPKKKTALDVMIWNALISDRIYMSWQDCGKYFTDRTYYELGEEGKKKVEDEFFSLGQIAQKLLFLTHSLEAVELFTWSGEYNAEMGDRLQNLYEILSQFGFSLEDEEQKKILDGTSELYLTGEAETVLTEEAKEPEARSEEEADEPIDSDESEKVVITPPDGYHENNSELAELVSGGPESGISPEMSSELLDILAMGMAEKLMKEPMEEAA